MVLVCLSECRFGWCFFGVVVWWARGERMLAGGNVVYNH